MFQSKLPAEQLKNQKYSIEKKKNIAAKFLFLAEVEKLVNR